MKDLIVYMQETECKIPVSQECDAIIDHQLEISADPLLKGEAQFFISLASETKLFENDYESEFEQVNYSLFRALDRQQVLDRIPIPTSGIKIKFLVH